MEVVNINFKLDEASIVISEKVAREKRIPFEVSADPFYNENKYKVSWRKNERLQSRTVKLSGTWIDRGLVWFSRIFSKYTKSTW